MNDIEYYMGLPYRIELERIPENLGGGIMASIPQLGRHAFCADGETVDEALELLEEVKRSLFTDYLEEGVTPAEPESRLFLEEFSGKFVVRIPKNLHGELVRQAKENNVSLNQYVASLLSRGVCEPSAPSFGAVEKKIDDLSGRVAELIERVAQISGSSSETSYQGDAEPRSCGTESADGAEPTNRDHSAGATAG